MTDIWIIDLNGFSSGESDFPSLLSYEEKTRADRFLRPLKKERFVLTRATVRSILSEYLGIFAKEIVFGYGKHGKPEIKNTRRSLYFNLSHSRNIAVLAISGTHRVGVDIEVMDKSLDRIDRIVDYLCSPEERDYYLALPITERPLFAYSLWTANEAFLKGIGSGVQRFASEVFYKFDSDREPCIRLKNNGLSSTWRFRHFTPVPNSVATLALEADKDRIDLCFFRPQLSTSAELFPLTKEEAVEKRTIRSGICYEEI
ncbi:MAG: 4'-phosphopantetheinyl transferase superfamily protein [Desulfohalobiaceae bacterium]|nr:4'-phosphopantetheinyl transferase superfamily protein [Desulfohalobiaceae bacterium]